MKPKKYVDYWDDGSMEYWALPSGKLHREDGPAILWYNEDGSVDDVGYWVNGKELTEEEWKIHRLPNTKIKLALYK